MQPSNFLIECSDTFDEAKFLFKDCSNIEVIYPHKRFLAMFLMGEYYTAKKIYEDFLNSKNLKVPELLNSITDQHKNVESHIGYQNGYITRYIQTAQKDKVAHLIPKNLEKYFINCNVPFLVGVKTNLEDGSEMQKVYIPIQGKNSPLDFVYPEAWTHLDVFDRSFYVRRSECSKEFVLPDPSNRVSWIEVDFEGVQKTNIYYSWGGGESSGSKRKKAQRRPH